MTSATLLVQSTDSFGNFSVGFNWRGAFEKYRLELLAVSVTTGDVYVALVAVTIVTDVSCATVAALGTNKSEVL